MQELDDNALLKRYTDQNSEEAFAALVAQHINKVYSVALRHTRNAHLAEEMTQSTFGILAQKARHLGKGVVLCGWLYQTARLSAVTLVRSEIRRTQREQEAHMQFLFPLDQPPQRLSGTETVFLPIILDGDLPAGLDGGMTAAGLRRCVVRIRGLLDR